jgi:hypothetical protein
MWDNPIWLETHPFNTLAIWAAAVFERTMWSKFWEAHRGLYDPRRASEDRKF